MEENSRKKQRKAKKIIVGILELALVIAAALGVMMWNHLGPFKVQEEARATAKPTASAVTYVNDSQEPEGEYVLDDAAVQNLRNELKNDEAINPDVKGILYFESGLVHKPILQGSDNAYYISHQWEDKSVGSTRNAGMLDYRNDLSRDDMNTIMYAHLFRSKSDAYDSWGFTVLRKLRDQANYEANKYIVFVTDTDIRYYEIAYGYNCPLNHTDSGDYPVPDLEYNRLFYDNQYFANYINEIKKIQYYDTGVNIDYGDKFLTLQTCLEESDDAHEVLLCKELGRKNF